MIARFPVAVAILGGLIFSTEARAGDPSPITSLRFLGAATIPNNTLVDGTPVGGLSGLDYDRKDGTFVAVSDDKSQYAPARFYRIRLTFQRDLLFSAEAEKAVTLLQASGKPYPDAKAGGEVPDPEAIRIDPQNGDIWWTSEGDRGRGLDPFLRVASAVGVQVASIETPAMFMVHPDREDGSRDNLSFEGLTFAPDGKSVWLGMEEAIYEDGPIATPAAGAVTRFTHLARDGKVLGQVAYPIDPIPAMPGRGKAADNGVSDILAVDDAHLLVTERSGVQAEDGSYRDYVRLYLADLTGATDVGGIPSLQSVAFQPVRKRLLLDLSKANIGYVDNIEGASFGPKLADGNDTLVLVSDNNFNPSEVTQFLAFEVER